jgi:aminoglycoside phosphotransferase (APT) family kinase protein
VGNNDDEVEVRETQGIDFEEFFLHLDKGGSVFVTLKPQNRDVVNSYRKEDLEFHKELPQQGGF